MLSYVAAVLLPTLLVRRVYGIRFIGLTGGISSGKSSVTNYLRSRGWYVLDFDALSREVVTPHHPSGTLSKIRNVFGPSVLHADGTLNRESLGKLIFSDPAARSKLNRLMKIPIWTCFFKHMINLTMRHGQKELILDVPLLFEAKMNWICAETIVVNVSHATQKKRLMERDSITSDVALSKINAQWPLSKKVALADTVIENDGTKADLHHALDEWNRRHKQELQQQPWWKAWMPTVPTLVIAAMATPFLLAANALLRWIIL